MLFRSFTLFLLGTTSAFAATDTFTCPPVTETPWTNALQVVIEQWAPTPDSPPTSPTSPVTYHQFVCQIHSLAPQLKQIHIRVDGPADPSPSQMDTLIAELHQQFGPELIIGFHPDNTNTSYSEWNCGDNQTWQCLLHSDLIYINQVECGGTACTNPQQLIPADTMSIFSIEQSYVIPQDQTTAQLVKTCLNGTISSTCPSMPVVKQPLQYGYVAPSCGGPTLYGPTAYDYGYPQMYNIESDWQYTGGQIPLPSGTYASLVSGQFYSLVDANTNCANYKYGMLPLQVAAACAGAKATQAHLRDSSVPTTIYNLTPSSHAANAVTTATATTPPDIATIAADYLSTIVINHYGAGTTPFPCGPTDGGLRYFLLSGEPDFLGGDYWTPAHLNEFYTQLMKKLTAAHVPDPQAIPFAIWDVDDMLHNFSGAVASTKAKTTLPTENTKT